MPLGNFRSFLMERIKVWKGVVGFEDLFEVSTLGRVKSLRTERVLKSHINKMGYETIATKIGGRKGISVCFRVHRLVAEAFIQNPEGKPQVNHIDGVKTNNQTTNLEWVTARENVLHAYKTGLATPTLGESQGQSKLTEGDVEYIRKNYISGDRRFGQRALSRRLGVAHTTIGDVVNRLSWAHAE